MTPREPRRTASVAAYDALAPHYQEVARARAAYLDAVDRIVLREIADGAATMLDVGSGDGERAARIAASRGIPVLVLSDPSERMAAECRRRSAAQVWNTAAEDLPVGSRRFDAVTCLWNVLGHVPDRASRLVALTKMRSLLAPRGVLVMDVQHRYNARAYGWLRTLGRFIHDLVRPSETNGDVSFTWRAGGSTIAATGHVFTDAEVRALAHEAGLRILRRHVVDYDTGASCRWACSGHLVYVLESGRATRGR